VAVIVCTCDCVGLTLRVSLGVQEGWDMVPVLLTPGLTESVLVRLRVALWLAVHDKLSTTEGVRVREADTLLVTVDDLDRVRQERVSERELGVIVPTVTDAVCEETVPERLGTEAETLAEEHEGLPGDQDTVGRLGERLLLWVPVGGERVPETLGVNEMVSDTDTEGDPELEREWVAVPRAEKVWVSVPLAVKVWVAMRVRLTVAVAVERVSVWSVGVGLGLAETVWVAERDGTGDRVRVELAESDRVLVCVSQYERDGLSEKDLDPGEWDMLDVADDDSDGELTVREGLTVVVWEHDTVSESRHVADIVPEREKETEALPLAENVDVGAGVTLAVCESLMLPVRVRENVCDRLRRPLSVRDHVLVMEGGRDRDSVVEPLGDSVRLNVRCRLCVGVMVPVEEGCRDNVMEDDSELDRDCVVVEEALAVSARERVCDREGVLLAEVVGLLEGLYAEEREALGLPVSEAEAVRFALALVERV